MERCGVVQLLLLPRLPLQLWLLQGRGARLLPEAPICLPLLLPLRGRGEGLRLGVRPCLLLLRWPLEEGGVLLPGVLTSPLRLLLGAFWCLLLLMSPLRW